MVKTDISEIICFKPHHFLCTLGFVGKGYSPKFVQNFANIKAYLESEEGKKHPIRITKQSDDICAPCPHKRGIFCQNEEKIQKIDEEHLEALNLQEEDIITWEAAKQQIRRQITLEVFHDICASCDWKKTGDCEQALKNLLQENITSPYADQ